MKYIFVINSFTLKDEINEVIHRIKDFCVKNNMEFEVEINNEDNSTEDIVKKYKKCGYTIVAVGADDVEVYNSSQRQLIFESITIYILSNEKINENTF